MMRTTFHRSQSAPFVLLVGVVATLSWLAPRASATLLSTHETFVSANSQSTYALTTYPVYAYSVAVTVDGYLLAPQLDYACDASKGTLTFKRPLDGYRTVTVSYRYDPTAASLRPATFSSPLAVQLLGVKDTSLNADVAYSGSGDGARPGMHLGLDGMWKSSRGLSFRSTAIYDGINQPISTPRSFKLTDTLGYICSSKWQVLNVSSTYSGDDRHPNNIDTKLSLVEKPSKYFVVSSAYDHTDSILTPGATTDNTSISAKVNPTEPVALEADESTSTTRTSSTYKNSLQATVTGENDTKIVAAVSHDTSGDTISSIESLTLNTAPAPTISVTSDVKLHDSTTVTPDSELTTCGASASVTVLGPLKLTGTCCQNPDDSGAPQALFRRGVGMATTVGPLVFSTDYTIDTRTASSTDTPDSVFDMSGKLQLTPYTKLTGKYQDKSFFGYCDRVRVYTLALTHDVTDLVSVSLSGTVNVQGQDTSTQNADTTTTATVGLKF